MKRIISVILILVCLFTPDLSGQRNVNPDASPEAVALLDLYYSISGKYQLTGQHNYPNTKDRNTLFAAEYAGQTPAIWSSDMGFAEDGNTDSYLARPDIVKEAIRQHRNGSIITICWHAVPPTANEPVTFRPSGPMEPGKLESIQGQLLDEQFRDVLTPGTELYKKWLDQVDSVAVYLKMLRDAKVPVLWRPYHEMNGDWFWWGGRVGEYGTIALYRQMYDRFVIYHQLNNLVWVWNVDRPSTPVRKFRNFYPGNEYLDILSLDVYGSDFNKDYYDSLMVLSNGKPLLFGEVGNPPMPDILDDQPNWASWVIWAGMTQNISREEHRILTGDPRILSKEDQAYREVMNPFRKACGLEKLPLSDGYPFNFSGEWQLDEGKSKGGAGGTVPHRIKIYQDHERMVVRKSFIVEWAADRSTEEEIYLDGRETKTMFFNSPRISVTSWKGDPVKMVIHSTLTIGMDGNKRTMESIEEWTQEKGGGILQIYQDAEGFRGGRSTSTLVYTKFN
ncbi:MAG: glycoside hydrolase family 26 protein [Bacteroidota bacterium]